MNIDTRGSWTIAPSGRRSERVQTYREGRLCAEPGCTTLLSMYNSSSRCAVHQRRGAVLRLRRLESEETERRCHQCGVPFITTNPRRKYCSARCRSHAFAARERATRGAMRRGADVARNAGGERLPA